MIKEFERFHGLVFARMLHVAQRSIAIKAYPTESNASYILNEDTGIYIKYSTGRMTPWRFSFMKNHQKEMDEMKKGLGEVFLILVCNDDGIVCLNYEELKSILNHQHDPIEWIRVVRHRRQMYTVTGSDGDLEFKIGGSEFPEKLFSANKSQKKGVLNWFRDVATIKNR